jgi:hypothetical protein
MRNLFDNGADKTINNLVNLMRCKVEQNGTKGAKQESFYEKWSEKAVKSLLKKMVKKRKLLEELERAIANEDPSTGCVVYVVPLPDRTDYGGQMKLFPHFVYSKVWRYPDLSTHHELKSVAHCLHPFNKAHRMEEICINPYHYDRIEQPRNPKVTVRKHTSEPSGSSMTNGSGTNNFSITDPDMLCPNGIPNMELTYEDTVDDGSNSNALLLGMSLNDAKQGFVSPASAAAAAAASSSSTSSSLSAQFHAMPSMPQGTNNTGLLAPHALQRKDRSFQDNSIFSALDFI